MSERARAVRPVSSAVAGHWYSDANRLHAIGRQLAT